MTTRSRRPAPRARTRPRRNPVQSSVRSPATPPSAPWSLLAGAASLFIGNAYQAQMPGFATTSDMATPGIAYSGHCSLPTPQGAVGRSGAREPRPAAATAADRFQARHDLGVRARRVRRVQTIAWRSPSSSSPGSFELVVHQDGSDARSAPRAADIRGRVIGLYAAWLPRASAPSAASPSASPAASPSIHTSLAVSAMMLLTVITGLLAFTLRSADREGKRG